MSAESCTCEACVKMCSFAPCWSMPEEASRLMDMGHAKRLMLDWRDNPNGEVYALCGSSPGRGGGLAPMGPVGLMGLFVPYEGHGRCAFLDTDDRCELHGVCKPREGREAHHDRSRDQALGLREEIAEAWDTPKGRAVVRRWRKAVGCTEEAYGVDDVWEDDE